MRILAEVIEIVDEAEYAWPLPNFTAKILASIYRGEFSISHLTYAENISSCFKPKFAVLILNVNF